MTAPRSWTIEHPLRPIPENELRKMHYRPRAEYVAAWRYTFKQLAKAKRIPKLDAAIVTVVQTCRTGTTLPDAGANFNTAKAAIDGIVDAGVLRNDGPAHLHAITFVAPTHATKDRFLLLIEDASEGASV